MGGFTSILWRLLKWLFKGWNIWCFLNFSNLLKIIFLYLSCIIWVIILEFDISEKFWSNSAYRLINRFNYFSSDRSFRPEIVPNGLSHSNRLLVELSDKEEAGLGDRSKTRYESEQDLRIPRQIQLLQGAGGDSLVSDGSGKISHSAYKRRMSIYSVNRIGEGMLYDRMLGYAKDNGYEYTGCKFSDEITGVGAIAHIYYAAASVLNFLLEPDFNLALTHHVNIVPYGYNIVYLNMPRHDLFSPYGKFLLRWKHLEDYDAYGDLYTLANGHNEILETISGKKPIIPIYLAERKVSYQYNVFNKALITGSLWGCSRSSLRMMLALKKLSQDDLLDAIGLDVYKYLGDHYLGQIEDAIKKSGTISEAVKTRMTLPDVITHFHREYGISLIVHNLEHRIDGIPTNRIAETAASGAIVISDRNKFIEKHFSDSVLFFDIDGNEVDIYHQIKDHINWIKSHPEMAKAMAQKSSEVFAKNFSIDVQMANIYSVLENLPIQDNIPIQIKKDLPA